MARPGQPIYRYDSGGHIADLDGHSKPLIEPSQEISDMLPAIVLSIHVDIVFGCAARPTAI
ncbi:MAG: hypothetical protein NUW12_07615 [Firmicutes bacterium]|jgi:hypothetical protein|nr:hypothetical protein [Bacillota bacterium]MDH7495484.1 hypothetical protein [Bacillota bacterium]